MASVQAQSNEGPTMEGYYIAAIAASFCEIVRRRGHLGRFQPETYSLDDYYLYFFT